MKTKEILIITGVTVGGLVLLGLSMGFVAALKLSAMVLGGWLMFVGIGIIIDLLSMKAGESVEIARAERRGTSMAHTAAMAHERMQEINNGKKYGEVVHGS